MNRFAGLAVLLSSAPALADDQVNRMGGVVVGITFDHGKIGGTFGVEGGVGIGPERVNAGLTWRRFGRERKVDTFGYVELDPWFIVGGTLGVGVGSESGVQPVLGAWEGIALPSDDSSCEAEQTIVSVSVGYRYTGVHELYLAPKIGRGTIPCLGSGRPLRDGEQLILPAAKPRRRDAVARYWTESARLESSSIASFVRLAHELTRAGAPSPLIDAARAAARDEARHTILCARPAGGAIVAAPPRAEPRPAASRTAALARLAVEAWHEGCVGEGIAAAEAAAAADVARDPDARSAQHTIARDESRHAELSWQILAWASRTGGLPVRHAIADAIAATRVPPPAPLPADPDHLAWHGVPTDPTVAPRAIAAALRRGRN